MSNWRQARIIEEMRFFNDALDRALVSVKERHLWPADGQAYQGSVDGEYCSADEVIKTARSLYWQSRSKGKTDLKEGATHDET